MKIVYLSSARLPSEKAHALQIARMCDALAGLGHEVVLLYPDKRQDEESFRTAGVWEYYDCTNQFAVESMSIFQLPDFFWRLPSLIHRPLFNSLNLWFEKRLAKKALKLAADVYVSRDMTPHAARAIAESGSRCVFEFHEAPSGALAKKSLNALTAQSDNVYCFAVTKMLASDIEDEFHLPSGGIEAHHDGVNLEMFETSREKPRRSKPLVTYAGSLQPNRGVDVLIEAARECPDVDFQIVGGVPIDVAKMRSVALELGVENISFVGHVRPEQVPEYLKMADLIVMPMRGNETHTVRHASPLKLFEYMASGTPIVATEMPSVLEVVKHRETAYLVKSDDPVSLMAGIKTVLADPELGRSMSVNAKSVIADYSWAKRAERILQRSEKLSN